MQSIEETKEETKKNEVISLGVTETTLKDLEDQYKNISIDLEDRDSVRLIVAGWQKVKDLRLGVQKKAKEIKADLNVKKKEIDNERDRIISRMEPLENRLKSEKQKEDDRKEAVANKNKEDAKKRHQEQMDRIKKKAAEEAEIERKAKEETEAELEKERERNKEQEKLLRQYQAEKVIEGLIIAFGIPRKFNIPDPADIAREKAIEKDIGLTAAEEIMDSNLSDVEDSEEIPVADPGGPSPVANLIKGLKSLTGLSKVEVVPGNIIPCQFDVVLDTEPFQADTSERLTEAESAWSDITAPEVAHLSTSETFEFGFETCQFKMEKGIKTILGELDGALKTGTEEEEMEEDIQNSHSSN